MVAFGYGLLVRERRTYMGIVRKFIYLDGEHIAGLRLCARHFSEPLPGYPIKR